MGMRADWICSALIAAHIVGCQSTRNGAPIGSDGGDARQVIILDAGPPVAVAPDGATQCTPGVCNYQTQAGCETGSMCHPRIESDQQVAPTCEPAGGQGAGETCSWLSCRPGYICAADGHCRHMCCGGDWSVCEANESCTGAIELLASGSVVPVPANVGLCEPTDDCDVFDPSSCPVGQSCFIVDSRGAVACLPSGSADAYETCSPAQPCKAGLTCVGRGNDNGQCLRLCRAVVGGGEPSCPANEGTVCAHFAKDPPGVGECVPAID